MNLVTRLSTVNCLVSVIQRIALKSIGTSYVVYDMAALRVCHLHVMIYMQQAIPTVGLYQFVTLRESEV